jgi:hypothetical protein
MAAEQITGQAGGQLSSHRQIDLAPSGRII